MERCCSNDPLPQFNILFKVLSEDKLGRGLMFTFSKMEFFNVLHFKRESRSNSDENCFYVLYSIFGPLLKDIHTCLPSQISNYTQWPMFGSAKSICKPVQFLVSENWVVLICKNLNSIYPRILETGLFFWRKRFLNFVNVFSLFCFSIWTNINSHFTKFGWNWPSGFWEEDETVKRLQSDVTDGLTVSRRSEKIN